MTNAEEVTAVRVEGNALRPLAKLLLTLAENTTSDSDLEEGQPDAITNEPSQRRSGRFCGQPSFAPGNREISGRELA